MKTEFHLEQMDFTIGRGDEHTSPDILLGSDPLVAPRHARVWQQGDAWWVEDLGSTNGTWVDAVRIDAPQRVVPGRPVQAGDSLVTWMEVEPDTALVVAELLTPAPRRTAPAAGGATPANPPPAPTAAARTQETSVLISSRLEGRQSSPVYFDVTRADAQSRLTQLMELPLLLAVETDLVTMCRRVLERMLKLIPGAERGAFLVYDPGSKKLALRASEPEDEPPLSRTLVKKAAVEGCGFIWNAGDMRMEASESMRRLTIMSGIYAPLMWQGEVMGVICVDNPSKLRAFNDEDLRFLMAVAHYAAAAISNHQMRASLRSYSTTLERLLTNFSPKLRNKLVERARTGGLSSGGERSDVTLLMSDLRGFTKVCAGLPVEDVVAMLNEYFSACVQIIFDHGGTVDKFIGDAILAVFGSPEPDPEQHVHAVQAALAMQTAMHAINQRRRAANLPACELGIGLHSGPVMHGFIGAAERLEFTVIGDAVNVTARVCDGAEPRQTLVIKELQAHIRNQYWTREKTIAIKHASPMMVWEIATPGDSGK